MEGLKQLMDALTVMRTNVLNQYAKKTGHTVEEVAAWMDATSWWTAAEAKENGFIDEITESNQTAKIENRNGALFVNSIAVPGTFDDAPEFVRNRAVVAPATTEGFVTLTRQESRTRTMEVTTWSSRTQMNCATAVPIW